MIYKLLHCPWEINSRSVNEKTTKQTESSTHIFIDCVSLHSDKPVHIQPLLLHLLLETHSNLHCLPTCLWAFAQDCFFWIKFVVCWICQQLYLPFQLANQCQIPLRPTFHLASLRKSWENPCVQAWTRLLHKSYTLYLWFVASELATFGNKYPSSCSHVRKHPHKPSQADWPLSAIRLLRQYRAPLDGFHLITGRLKSQTLTVNFYLAIRMSCWSFTALLS